mmetsp:Transcript_26050/g.66059  ORF Transcript_26050/g.66059 Transcript_26050/m.66059 type:complete len:227 (+) Transcript_26050:1307-1987(+)
MPNAHARGARALAPHTPSRARAPTQTDSLNSPALVTRHDASGPISRSRVASLRSRGSPPKRASARGATADVQIASSRFVCEDVPKGREASAPSRLTAPSSEACLPSSFSRRSTRSFSHHRRALWPQGTETTDRDAVRPCSALLPTMSSSARQRRSGTGRGSRPAVCRSTLAWIGPTTSPSSPWRPTRCLLCWASGGARTSSGRRSGIRKCCWSTPSRATRRRRGSG